MALGVELWDTDKEQRTKNKEPDVPVMSLAGNGFILCSEYREHRTRYVIAMYYTVSFWVFGFESAAFRLWRMVLTNLFV
jgi:hypothetical protein